MSIAAINPAAVRRLSVHDSGAKPSAPSGLMSHIIDAYSGLRKSTASRELGPCFVQSHGNVGLPIRCRLLGSLAVTLAHPAGSERQPDMPYEHAWLEEMGPAKRRKEIVKRDLVREIVDL